jgi:hypothetical protein
VLKAIKHFGPPANIVRRLHVDETDNDILIEYRADYIPGLESLSMENCMPPLMMHGSLEKSGLPLV